jgi:lysine-specific demethylase 3
LILKKFFDGFSVTSRRTVKDREGKPAVIRLSDWPPQSGDDFMNSLPVHTTDFQKSLPLPIYTTNKEHAFFNLSASLPEVFMRPDVGPRALLSYGPGTEDEDEKANFNAVVNLTSESCDTLSLLAHAAVPRDLNRDSFRTDVIKLMESSGCDPTSCRRVKDAKELPGILWHVFHPSDADKIKDLLHKIVSKEKADKRQQSRQAKTPKKRPGRPTSACDPDSSDESDNEKLDKNFDVIQEESHYLDEEAIETLKKEDGVTPFVIAQCPGEAIMLPAGTPFQMKHILSCISLSSDFVSPEHISRSFYLTRQMRHLSEQQIPAEDKIQIKNLIYHSVKNALSTLDASSTTDIKPDTSLASPVKEEIHN